MSTGEVDAKVNGPGGADGTPGPCATRKNQPPPTLTAVSAEATPADSARLTATTKNRFITSLPSRLCADGKERPSRIAQRPTDARTGHHGRSGYESRRLESRGRRLESRGQAPS